MSSKGEHLDIWAWILYCQGSMCSLCTFNAVNLYFKYCSDTLLGSPFGKLLVSFVLSFSPLICWFDYHLWFRSLTRLIKPVAQPVFEVISMENVVLYARVLLWWWFERWPPISFFIALQSSVFSLSLCLYWRFGMDYFCQFILLFSLFLLLFSLFLLLFIGLIALFGTIHGSHYTISTNFYLHL